MATTTSKVQYVYDSLSRVLEDSQTYPTVGGNTRNVTASAWQSLVSTQCA